MNIPNVPLLLYFLLGSSSMRDLYILERIYNADYNIDIPGYSLPSSKRGFQKKNVSQNFYLNRDYLLRKNQERKCYSRFTEISGKGLEKRIMNRVRKNITKDINSKNEKGIEKSFARKDKSRRWKKRHHQNV